jgi:hypothetical protein
VIAPALPQGDPVNQKKAMLQLRIVAAVLRQARDRGQLGPELRERAAVLVETTVRQVEPAAEHDDEWVALVESVRTLVARD